MTWSWYEPSTTLGEAEVERARRTSSWRSTRLCLAERGETPQTDTPAWDALRRLPAKAPSRRGSGETHPRSNY